MTCYLILSRAVRGAAVALLIQISLLAQSGDSPAHWMNSDSPGAVVVCGGGTLSDEILNEFVALAGDSKARLVVIPTASAYADRDDAEQRFGGPWKRHGLASVEVLHSRNRNRTNQSEFVQPLRAATAVWFSGGQQSRLTEAYVGTKVEQEIYALLRRGGVVGGTSAGAAIQSRTMIAGGSPPQATVSTGFNLLPGTVIDQHFLRRRRQPRLMEVLASHPGHVGLGIDEGTALVARGDHLKVLGSSTVTVCFGRTENRPSETKSLSAGSEVHLNELRATALERLRTNAVTAGNSLVEKPKQLLTVAERSSYEATSTYAEVMDFCRQLADQSDVVMLSEIGKSHEQRSIPLLIVSDPPVQTPEQASRSDKLVVLAMGNIHAGEVCGKAALLMLARELGIAENAPLLDDLVILLVPIYNTDGNERFSKQNRPGQNGPRQGMGQRANAQGLDLNRDHMKLESPEARSLTRLLSNWNPAVVIDCHTTNGSHHRYALTYDGPRHPATNPDIVRYVRDEFLPDVSERLHAATGYKTFYYGNFDEAHRRWLTYPALPRYSTHYIGLRQRIGILSEAYAYAPFRDRVLATLGFVEQCFQRCADQREPIHELLQAAGKNKADPAMTPTKTAIRMEHALLPSRFQVLGYQRPYPDAESREEPKPQKYEVQFDGLALPTREATAPWAYLIPEQYDDVVKNLQYHGVQVELLREDVQLDLQQFRITDVKRDPKLFQGHHLVETQAELQETVRMVSAGTFLVRTPQPLRALIVNLLEPESQDGLTAWNYFDKQLSTGATFPITRLADEVPLLTVRVPAPKDKSSVQRKPITFETLYGRQTPRFGGSPISGLVWANDGRHYRQTKNGRIWRVSPATGRCEPVEFQSVRFARQLARQLDIELAAAQRLSRQVWRNANKQRTATILQHGRDIYHAELDKDSTTTRLTDTPEEEELATFSPNGEWIAFVQDFDLHVVDIQKQRTRRLTDGGSSTLRNGKCDWVYYEEIYARSWRAYRWSPDSKSIAFLQFDDSPVSEFTVLNHLRARQQTESDRYPLAGQPNPRVRLAVVDVQAGDVQWVDLSDYSPDNMLIRRFGWTPDSKSLLFYVQNRSQRWLDVVRYDLNTGTTTKLLREKTGTWVDDPGDPHYLKDGSFLLFSERDGWKHIYRYAADGTMIRRVTKGPWEVRRIHAIDEENGWVYISATRDSHIANNLYRMSIDGSKMERLTRGAGDHRVTVSPNGTYFVDSNSDHRTPTQVDLYETNGRFVRKLDLNPVFVLDEYQLSKVELLQIPTRDGTLLEASLVKPFHFDPSRKYPVWLMTYGGPHAPRASDSWRGGRTFDQLLAQMGIIALTVDPRSASGKGAASTWTAYRQLGVQELRDLEDALDWLTEKPFVDPDRIGMSGHSYGGFMTAYAMTHCQRFAAGIAGAPVTDWRNYDTFYTERYMDTPQENPEGYARTSVVRAARKLHGNLLLIHGARDDNVHLANTLQLVHALQKANKKFELMIYPESRHGISGNHYRRLVVDFIRRNMLGR